MLATANERETHSGSGKQEGGETELVLNKRGWEAAEAGEPCRSSLNGVFARGPRRDGTPVRHGPRRAGGSPRHQPRGTDQRRGEARRGGWFPPLPGAGPRERLTSTPRPTPSRTGKWARERPEGAGTRRPIGRRSRVDTESCGRVGGPL